MVDRFTLFVRDDKRCKAVKPITRLVLYALAARADKNGSCYPSVEQIMCDTGLGKTSVFKALKTVRDILNVDGPGYKQSNLYTFPYVDNQFATRTNVRDANNNSSPREPDKFATRTPNSSPREPEVRQLKKDNKFSLSLTLSNDQNQCSHVHNYDGTTKPTRREDIERIRQWCGLAALDKWHTDEFIRINRAARWSRVDSTTTVSDLIADFRIKWQHDDPDGFNYHIQLLKERGVKFIL